MPTITSLTNPRVKDAVRLRSGRHRKKRGRILIDGARELLRAIEAGVPLVEVFVCRPLCTTDRARRVLAKLADSEANVWEVSEAVFEKLGFGRRTDGTLGVARMPRSTLGEFWLPACPLVVVLEGLEKPGNVGAIVRSGDAAGVDAVVVTDPATDLYNPNAIRASLGTLFSMRVCVAEAGATLAWLRERGLCVYAARVDGAIPYTDADFSRPAAIVLGSEAAGLGPQWSAADVTTISLPMRGVADSLNVSATGAVLFYEALRQRDSAY